MQVATDSTRLYSYRALGAHLWQLQKLGRLATTYRELAGPLPERALAGVSPGDLVEGILSKVEFPVHDLLPYEMDEVEILEVPMAHFIHFEGLDPDDEWEYWPDPFKLCISLFEAGLTESLNAYGAESSLWWAEMTERYELPPLEVLEYAELRERLEGLDEPWDGLTAIMRWCDADTGNVFVDIPCGYSHEWDLEGLDWSVKSIHYLTEQYQWAQDHIFRPGVALVDLCQANSAAMRICFDLVLGRETAGWVIQDGELIITEADYEQ